ncbi:uncharacterized protein B0T15DRAFT_13679 [Chaetomium strumarium]|uniref:Uncharacterized protein n=1 Tax=Chaetomium strumarium TaxID=1170767 RepID=A0AAJ0H0U2_9PEZI|nr:hypothetical protein B0T15DRAFT_13679 [Chaetomium strumarium]
MKASRRLFADRRGKSVTTMIPSDHVTKKSLVFWGFVIVDNGVDERTLENSATVFKTAYTGHGGVIQKKADQQHLKQHEASVLRLQLQIDYSRSSSCQLLFFFIEVIMVLHLVTGGGSCCERSSEKQRLSPRLVFFFPRSHFKI